MTLRRAPKPAKKLREEAQGHLRSAYQSAILDAAARVFVRLGLHEARMADLAAEVGVSVGTLYNYFESKEQVLEALAVRERDGFVTRLTAAREAPDPVARLRATVKTALGFVEELGVLFALYSQLGMSNETDIKRLGGTRALEGYVRLLAELEADLAEAAKEGHVRDDVPPRLLAATLGGMLNAMIFTWLQDGRKDSLVDRQATVLDLFMKGAAKP